MSARPGRILADLHVPIPRPRSFDTIVSHPSYAKLASEIRGLLNAQEGAPND
jgi:NitT/TauT family transport system ATP-binding protein